VSGRRDREARREERLREGERAGTTERRQRLIKVASALAFLAVAVVAVLIVVSQNSGGGGDASNLQSVSEVQEELSGIPQNGMVLGQPGAKVTLLEFADLQCPVCKAYSEEVLPQIVETQVSSGDVKVDYRAYTIIDQDSVPAAAAAIAAGKQGRGWNFVETFYRNQGQERSGYVTDEFLTAVAQAAGVRDIAGWNRDRVSEAVLSEVKEQTAEAQELGFTGTPSFAVEGPGTQGVEAIGTPSSAEALEEAISAAR
jgi:protein-disulfide isomerase